MNENKIINNLKQMAWERAKGELRSILHLFWGEMDDFERFQKSLVDFFKEVEDNSIWL